MTTTKSLFHEQELLEDTIAVDGIRLHPNHLLDYRKLRSVLGLTSHQVKALIEQWGNLETICAQAAVGMLLPISLGRRVNDHFQELTAD